MHRYLSLTVPARRCIPLPRLGAANGSRLIVHLAELPLPASRPGISTPLPLSQPIDIARAPHHVIAIARHFDAGTQVNGRPTSPEDDSRYFSESIVKFLIALLAYPPVASASPAELQIIMIMASLHESLLRLAARLDALDSRLAGFEARLTARMDVLDSRLAGIEGRLTGVEKKLSGVEGKLSGVEGRLTDVEEKLTVLQSHVVQLRIESARDFDLLDPQL